MRLVWASAFIRAQRLPSPVEVWVCRSVRRCGWRNCLAVSAVMSLCSYLHGIGADMYGRCGRRSRGGFERRLQRLFSCFPQPGEAHPCLCVTRRRVLPEQCMVRPQHANRFQDRSGNVGIKCHSLRNGLSTVTGGRNATAAGQATIPVRLARDQARASPGRPGVRPISCSCSPLSTDPCAGR